MSKIPDFNCRPNSSLVKFAISEMKVWFVSAMNTTTNVLGSSSGWMLLNILFKVFWKASILWGQKYDWTSFEKSREVWTNFDSYEQV